MCLRSFGVPGTLPSRLHPSVLLPASARATQRLVRIRNLGRSSRHTAAALAGRAKRLHVVAFRDASDRGSTPASLARGMGAVEHVSIEVDYYRLLQVARVSRPDAIRKAYDMLVKQPPATAYSADTLFARAVLLKAAAESLIDPELRRSYDAKLAAGHGALRVSQQDLPGALVVLQEIGEFQLVLSHGIRWLELNGAQPDAGDVAAAVALAYCDRAGERLAAPNGGSGHIAGAVLPACDDLDAALVKLRRYGMAKQLQSQIVGALRDLAPEYACELAALPLGPETSARRAKGVALMRGVLRSAAAVVTRGSGTAIDGEGGEAGELLLGADADPQSTVGHARRMLQRGRDVLTCGEQVALLPDALRGTGATPHPDVLYDGALAHIVEGYRNGWPHSVHAADRLLHQLEEAVQKGQAEAQREQQDLAAAAAARHVQHNGSAAAAAAAGADAGTPGMNRHEDGPAPGGGEGPQQQSSNVALERAVCAVLLGDYEAATAVLGLGTPAAESGGGGTGPGADAQLRSFVMEHAPGDSRDMRPGLRALATKWLEGVALASFRDTAGSTALPLETSWFADLRVITYLQVWRLNRSERVLAAAHLLCNLLPNLAKLVAAGAQQAAAMAALLAARVQRIAAALATLAAAVASDRRHRSAPSLPSGCGQQPSAAAAAPSRPLPAGKPIGGGDSGAGAGVVSAHAASSPALAAPAPTTSPAAVSEAAAGLAEAAAATALDHQPQPAPAVADAATAPSPFGHPTGKTLRSFAPTDDASASPRSARTADALAARASPAAAAAAASAAPNMRRRFAASAAADSAEGLPTSSSPAALEMAGRLRGDRFASFNGGGGEHHDDDHDDDHDIAAAVEEHPDLADHEASSSSGPRRGMTEQDLRAHLAGLEAAMWDSELPGAGGRGGPQRLAAMVLGGVALLAALFYSVLRRNGGGGAATCAPPSAPPSPAVVSISVSALVSPN